MLSGKLLALLIELTSMAYTHTELSTLFLKLGFQKYATGGRNKQERVQTVVSNIQSDDEPNISQKLYLAFLGRVLEDLYSGWGEERFSTGEWPAAKKAQELLAELPANGLAFKEGKIVPTTPEPAALAPEISALQMEMSSLGLETAAVHYGQALDNFQRRQWESSNGQLRSFLENLYVELCKRKLMHRYGDAVAAIQALQQRGFLDSGEFNIARGLFEASNERGAHHGLSEEQEALFRFHFSTALGRYLVARLQ